MTNLHLALQVSLRCASESQMRAVGFNLPPLGGTRLAHTDLLLNIPSKP